MLLGGTTDPDPNIAWIFAGAFVIALVAVGLRVFLTHLGWNRWFRSIVVTVVFLALVFCWVVFVSTVWPPA